MITETARGTSRRRFLKGAACAGVAATFAGRWAVADIGIRKWPAPVELQVAVNWRGLLD